MPAAPPAAHIFTTSPLLMTVVSSREGEKWPTTLHEQGTMSQLPRGRARPGCTPAPGLPVHRHACGEGHAFLQGLALENLLNLPARVRHGSERRRDLAGPPTACSLLVDQGVTSHAEVDDLGAVLALGDHSSNGLCAAGGRPSGPGPSPVRSATSQTAALAHPKLPPSSLLTISAAALYLVTTSDCERVQPPVSPGCPH